MIPQTPIPAGLQAMSFVELANFAVALGVIIAGALSIYYVFVAGISMILSGGDQAKIQKATKAVQYAITGLTVTILSVVAVGIIGSIFGIDLVSYLRWDMITAMMDRVVSTLTNESVTSGGSLQ